MIEVGVRLDFVGNHVKVGDKVAFNPPKWKGLERGVVTGFTPKGVRVAYTSQYGYEEVSVREDVVAIK